MAATSTMERDVMGWMTAWLLRAPQRLQAIDALAIQQSVKVSSSTTEKDRKRKRPRDNEDGEHDGEDKMDEGDDMAVAATPTAAATEGKKDVSFDVLRDRCLRAKADMDVTYEVVASMLVTAKKEYVQTLQNSGDVHAAKAIDLSRLPAFPNELKQLVVTTTTAETQSQEDVKTQAWRMKQDQIKRLSRDIGDAVQSLQNARKKEAHFFHTFLKTFQERAFPIKTSTHHRDLTIDYGFLSGGGTVDLPSSLTLQTDGTLTFLQKAPRQSLSMDATYKRTFDPELAAIEADTATKGARWVEQVETYQDALFDTELWHVLAEEGRRSAGNIFVGKDQIDAGERLLFYLRPYLTSDEPSLAAPSDSIMTSEEKSADVTEKGEGRTFRILLEAYIKLLLLKRHDDRLDALKEQRPPPIPISLLQRAKRWQRCSRKAETLRAYLTTLFSSSSSSSEMQNLLQGIQWRMTSQSDFLTVCTIFYQEAPASDEIILCKIKITKEGRLALQVRSQRFARTMLVLNESDLSGLIQREKVAYLQKNSS